MRRFFQLVVAFMPLLVSPAHAAELPYSKSAFDRQVSSGQPAAVVLHADWCPTCRAQAPVLRELAATPEFQAVTIFVADFDQEKSLRQTLNASQQSTIVTFYGGHEVARSTGATDRERLAQLLRTALGPTKH